MNALVMYDHQTDSLWSHFTGDAITGPLAGTKLEILPAIQTTWERWKELHPDSPVLAWRSPTPEEPGGALGFQFDLYQNYYVSGASGFGQTRRDDRLYRKEFVLGLLIKSKAKAYAFGDLNENPVVNDSFAGTDLVVTFDPKSATGGTFRPDIPGRTLNFQPTESPGSGSPLMVDDETGSLWQMLTGEAIEGELKGTFLEQIPSNYSFWFAWKDWHPSTQLFLSDDLPS